jgi:outer membrane receptor for ferrienterochelin and colicins
MRPTLSANLLLFLFTCALNAQNRSDTLPDAQLNQVVVTAQFVPTDVRQTVNSVRVLDRRTIERRAAVNLEELLQTQPNIRLSQDAVLGSALSINGLRGENVKILVDGVPVVGRLNGSVDAGQLPLGAVQQVEIIEGAQSLLYGSEASAGVINLVTRKSQPYRVEAEGNTQWESNGFRNMQGRSGVQLGKCLLQLTGNRLGFLPAADTAQGRNQLWNPKTQTAGRAMLRYAPSDRLDLRISGGLFSEKVDNLGELRRPRYKPYAFDDYYFTDRRDVTFQAEGWTTKRWFWQATAGWNRFDRIKNTYRYNFDESERLLLEGEQDTSAAAGLLTRFTLASDRRDRRWNFLFGLENYSELAEGVRIVDSTAAARGRAHSRDLGVFASAKASFFERKLTLQGGARWTNNQLYGMALTPSVWLLWQPLSQVQARFSYANGFRSPGLKELYFNFIDVNHFIVGSTDLRPERSDNLRGELNWRYIRSEQFSLGVTASGFHNRVRDRIILAEFAPVQYRYGNLSKWETTGGGLGFSLGIGDWMRFRSEWVRTGFFNTYSESAAGRKGDIPRLSWSADWVSELAFFFFSEKAGLTIWHKHTGRTPFFYEQNNQIQQGTTEGWDLLNAAANANLFKNGIRLNVGIKNLLNVRQIQSRTSGDIGHAGDDLRPVHWGRTFFVNAIFYLHTKK